ncbi:heme-binding protein [Amycolatopsis cynarae]|uniref:Heme-binding protein n=1 Tax=Amycolatopsis cynarae TaxID=2995223 RepID=A0ABY7BDJ4_9PSEU|nr:heme-binding protein [Amycolatopsis sp. HUAS 11-8]WAL68693.1 heme-binding protein [Amycolatopsis sp. HUAS 11-8]
MSLTEHTPAKTHNAPSISRAAAVALIEAVRKEATEAGIDVATAITDAGGHLVAFERADRTPFLAAEVAVDKAWTAASFRLSTHTWNSLVADPHVAPLAQHPRLMAVGGGFPLFDNGVCVGGLGISGGTAEQDENVARAALKAEGFRIPD